MISENVKRVPSTMKRMMRYLVLAIAGALLSITPQPTFAQAQKSTGPLLPHVGLEVTTAFHNVGGRDAESYSKFTAVTPTTLSIAYASSRGMFTKRDIRAADRQSSRTYVIGYAPSMPAVIPGTTSGGISIASLAELRAKVSALEKL